MSNKPAKPVTKASSLYWDASEHAQELYIARAKELAEKNEKIILEALAKNADPPITGEITEDKLRNRKIMLVQKGKISWLTQRGIRISEDMHSL